MSNCAIEPRLLASFKGVTFYALTGGGEVGRRGAEGEFPFGEETAYADLGRKIRVFKLKARFAGPGYIEDSQALLDACESKGPGELIHPTRGPVQVACRTAEFSEDYEEADGVCEIDLDFVEAGSSSLNLNQLAGVAIDGALGALFDGLAGVWDALDAIPFFAIGDAIDLAGELLNVGADAIGFAVALAPSQAAGRALSDLAIIAQDPGALRSSATVTTLLRQTFDIIDTQGSDPASRFAAGLQMANWSARTLPPSAAAPAMDVLLSTTRAAAAGYMARAAQDAGKTTLDAALKQVGQIAAILNQEIALALSNCDNARHLTLRSLYATTVQPLNDLAFQSPPIVTYQLLGGLPSVVAAHEIYGDARRFGEIEAMNAFAPPWGVGPKVFATRQ